MRRPLSVGLAAGLTIALCGAIVVGAPPGDPTITEPSAPESVHPAGVHMEATGFTDPDGHAHDCSDWEIRTLSPSEPVWQAPCARGPERVHIHLGDGAFLGSHAGRKELHPESDYLLRVRFRDSTGAPGGWAERPFKTISGGPAGTPSALPWTVRQPRFRVEIVAGGLQLPVKVAFVPRPGRRPGDPLLYVSELYGTIKVVARDGTVSDYAHGLLNFDPTGQFPGSGEKGLTGIVVDPVTGDVLASLVYEDGSAAGDPKPHYAKVVRLHSRDGGLTAASQTTVLDMPGEPQGPSHQVSNLTIGPDRMLYVHNGDGFDHTTARNLDSFRGKILRMELDGAPARGNPFYRLSDGVTARDYVLAYGFRNPFGGGWRAADAALYQIENGPSVDRLAKVVAGRNYRWNGTDESMRAFALYTWDPSHAPVDIAFAQPQTASGSGFPASKMGHAFVTESGPTYATGPQVQGKRIVEFRFARGKLAGPRPLVEYVGSGKATAAGLAAGPDGLYFTDLYKDMNAASPIERGANLLRVRYVGPCGNLIAGTRGSDRLIGTAIGDRMRGGRGRDVLRGRGGADCLSGGPGADRLYGGPGADRLYGGPGGDFIHTGRGDDRVLAGARGRNRILARHGRNRVRCGPGYDVVIANRRSTVARSCDRVIRR